MRGDTAAHRASAPERPPPSLRESLACGSFRQRCTSISPCSSASSLAMNLASQMIAVAIGWQVYDVHHRAFDLGLSACSSSGRCSCSRCRRGSSTDRVSRDSCLAPPRRCSLAIAAALVAVSVAGAHLLWPFLALAAASGGSDRALLPGDARALPACCSNATQLPSGLAHPLGRQPGSDRRRSRARRPPVRDRPRGRLRHGARAVRARRCRVLAMSVPPRRPPAEPSARARARSAASTSSAARRCCSARSCSTSSRSSSAARSRCSRCSRSRSCTSGRSVSAAAQRPGAWAPCSRGVMLVRRPLAGRAGPTLIAVVSIFGACMIVFGLSR